MERKHGKTLNPTRQLTPGNRGWSCWKQLARRSCARRWAGVIWRQMATPVKSKRLVLLGLAIAGSSLASTSGTSHRAGIVCRIDEGIYKEGVFRTAEGITVLIGGGYWL